MKPGQVKDEFGKRYGMLTVIRPYKMQRNGMAWLCRCDCGREVAVGGVYLRMGSTKSCGCLRQMDFETRKKLGYWPGGPETKETEDREAKDGEG